MKKFAALAVAASMFALAACEKSPPEHVPAPSDTPPPSDEPPAPPMPCGEPGGAPCP